MNAKWHRIESVISRRNALKSLAGLAAGPLAGSSLNAFDGLPLIPNSPNPSWYGFNLLEYFSTDPDWMKYFPYNGDGQFKEDDFRWMRDWGFNWVRLPMDYRFWTSPGDPLKIDEGKVLPIDRAIRLGETYGVHVNICLHRAPGECVLDGMDASLTGIRVKKETTSVYKDPVALTAFTHQWSYFANRYRSISNERLSFNLVNEPSEYAITDLKALEKGVPGKDDYARVATAAIKTIRQQDPKRTIISDGYPLAQDPIPQLFGSGVMQSCHDYTPFQLTHYQNEWARPFSNNLPLPTWPLKDRSGKILADKSTKQSGLRKWADLANYNVPIHFGELGCDRHTPPAVAYAWFDDSLDIINALHSGWALWNLRGPFGIVDSNRSGTQYKDWYGHQLDVTLLEILKRKMSR